MFEFLFSALHYMCLPDDNLKVEIWLFVKHLKNLILSNVPYGTIIDVIKRA